MCHSWCACEWRLLNRLVCAGQPICRYVAVMALEIASITTTNLIALKSIYSNCKPSNLLFSLASVFASSFDSAQYWQLQNAGVHRNSVFQSEMWTAPTHSDIMSFIFHWNDRWEGRTIEWKKNNNKKKQRYLLSELNSNTMQKSINILKKFTVVSFGNHHRLRWITIMELS